MDFFQAACRGAVKTVLACLAFNALYLVIVTFVVVVRIGEDAMVLRFFYVLFYAAVVALFPEMIAALIAGTGIGIAISGSRINARLIGSSFALLLMTPLHVVAWSFPGMTWNAYVFLLLIPTGVQVIASTFAASRLQAELR